MRGQTNMNIKLYQKEIKNLRQDNEQLIAISNAEWFSLFKDEIRNSIAIEGVFANRNDLLNVLEKHKQTKNQKTAAILGYFEAASSLYDYAYNQYREKEFVLRMSDIKQVHTILMRYEKELGSYIGEIGEFRKENVQVAYATFNPIDVYFVRDALQLFIKWYNLKKTKKKYNPITLAAISHIWFETIHPFRDGNGRVGRILLSYLLLGSGFLNIAIKGVAKADRERYYHALESSDDCFETINKRIESGTKTDVHKVEKIIEKQDFSLFENLICESLESSINRLKRKSKAYANNEAEVPLRELARIFGYSKDYLRNLINRGQLKAHRKGKLWYVRIRDMETYLNKKE